MQSGTEFWDGIAVKYRTTAISDTQAYEATLDRVASYLKRSDQVLEIGCGTGGTALKLAPFAKHITATDFSEGMIAQAVARTPSDSVDFRAVSAFDTSLDKERYHAVLAFNFLHLVEDFRNHIERIHGLLAPGGLFMSKTPCLTDPSAKLKFRLMVKAIPVMQMLGKAPFVTFRTIADIQNTIEDVGFEIVETGNYPVQPPCHFVVARKL